jgi:putative endonuclease
MREPRRYFVYVLASQRNGTLYTGITGDLVNRIWQHRSKVREGFTSTYNVTMLVYYEWFDDPGVAIRREKRIKRWKRKWKLELIEGVNPLWRDLYDEQSGIAVLPVDPHLLSSRSRYANRDLEPLGDE